MKLKISYKQMKQSDAIDERIQEKSERLEKYFQGNTNVHWVCWVHEEQHWAELKVHGPKFDFFAKASADNMYKSLDLVVDKIERQFEKQKNIKRNKIHHSSKHSPKEQQIQSIIRDEEEAIYQREDQSA